MAEGYDYKKYPHKFLKIEKTDKDAYFSLRTTLKMKKGLPKDFKEQFLKSTPTLKYIVFGGASASASGTVSYIESTSTTYDWVNDMYHCWNNTGSETKSGFAENWFSPFGTSDIGKIIPNGSVGEQQKDIPIEFNEARFESFIYRIKQEACEESINEQASIIDEYGHVGLPNETLKDQINILRWNNQKKSFLTADAKVNNIFFVMVPCYCYSIEYKGHTYTIYISATNDESAYNTGEYKELKKDKQNEVLKVIGKVLAITSLITLPFLIPFVFIDTLVKASWLWALFPLIAIGYFFYQLAIHPIVRKLIPDRNIFFKFMQKIVFLVSISLTFGLFFLGAHFAPTVKISTGEQLNYIHNYGFANYELTQDIDVQSVYVKPVRVLWGTFNGNNFTIKNIDFTQTYNTCGFVKNLFGTIKDVHFVNYNINYAGLKNAGALVGTMHFGLIDNVTISQKDNKNEIILHTMVDFRGVWAIIGIDKQMYYGGLVGYQKSGIIRNVKIDSKVKFQIDDTITDILQIQNGGIVGHQNKNAKLENYDVSKISFMPPELDNIQEDDVLYTELEDGGYINRGKVIGNLKTTN